MKLKFFKLQSKNPCLVCVISVFAGLLASCTPRISPPVLPGHLQTPADFPEAYYRQAEVSGSKVLQIDSARSLVTIIVRRGGPLARLGHDHVIASHELRGYVDISGERADLYLELERLSAD